MLTLFTGAPGSGKTAALMEVLSERLKDRPLYVHRSKYPTEGVTPFSDELKLPHTPIDGDEWHNVVPDGGCLVVDEVQDLWRARGPSVKASEAVMALETSRHRGIDVYMTTQQPSLLDKNVRALVGRHVHIRDLGVMGRWWYEWPEVSQALAWKGAPLKKRYRLPKQVFSLYKSSSLHIKPIRSFPKILVVFVGCLALLGAGSYYVYGRIMAKQGPNSPLASPSIKPTTGVAPAGVAASGANGKGIAPITAQSMIEALKPRLTDRPESAPLYDDMRKVVAMQRIIGGFCQGEVCRCYDQRGGDPGLNERQCKAWIAKAPWDPYYSQAAPTVTPAQPVQPPAQQPASSS